MCKVNFYLRAANREGRHLVYLQIKIYGKKIVASTKLMVETNNWNHETQRVKHKDIDYRVSLNNYLDRIADEGERYHDLLLSQGKMTADNPRIDLLTSGVKSIIQFAKPVNPAKILKLPTNKKKKRKAKTKEKPMGLLTRKQVATTFGIQPRTIINWEKRGILKPAFYINGRPRYIIDDVTKVGTEKQVVYFNEKATKKPGITPTSSC